MDPSVLSSKEPFLFPAVFAVYRFAFPSSPICLPPLGSGAQDFLFHRVGGADDYARIWSLGPEYARVPKMHAAVVEGFFPGSLALSLPLIAIAGGPLP